jgi:two-component sensor histidine kinase
MAQTVHILLLEDSDIDADLIGAYLDGGDYTIERVRTKDAYIAALDRRGHHLVLSDYSLSTFDGRAALTLARAKVPDVPFIFVSGCFGEETATEALKEGATDYVLKQRLIRLPAAVKRALAEAEDRAERRYAEERSRFLVAEMTHRVKNTLATVMALAQQTIVRSATLPEFQTSFFSRLQSLADAHALLFKTDWTNADLTDVVDVALKPFRREDTGRIEVKGEPLSLSPQQALTINLILHELATNAGKYGALSARSGKVSIEWDARGPDASRRINLRWKEEGGPAVVRPTRRGFGTRLIHAAAANELNGSASLTFPPTGAECELIFSAPPGGREAPA